MGKKNTNLNRALVSGFCFLCVCGFGGVFCFVGFFFNIESDSLPANKGIGPDGSRLMQISPYSFCQMEGEGKHAEALVQSKIWQFQSS